jgi:N-methylhydantoinase A
MTDPLVQNVGTRPRLGVDIGGTFTDVALEIGQRRYTTKVLTTHQAPERGVMDAIARVLGEANVAPATVALVIHGTTLATNALIERKGAVTALVTTEGFRDSVEMGTESRFAQYDVNIEKPPPLVPRRLRLPVTERINAKGEVLVALDEETVAALVPVLQAQRVTSIAVGLLHSYANPAHERRVGEILAEKLPGLSVTLSSDVSPEMREYERLSTACANAYVRPLMESYLGRLDRDLRDAGFTCPLFLMLSGGGITTLETAMRYPVRLVESGPAGGAIFASHLARQCGLDRVLSYDMGGTTAKICMLDDYRPQTARTFEVARVYRFAKGSGLPLRIPVIEMVEIGAGGGSIARVDGLGRIAVGPDSAGSEPGPACYGRGGAMPTVTDADLALGRIDPAAFSGGRMTLDGAAATGALMSAVGEPLKLDAVTAAFGVAEMVDENMASAARMHAIESGKTLDERTLIAFGGAAPLHAARMAEKLGMRRVLIPTGAGVGSTIGFLRAPVAYEIARTGYQRLSRFEFARVNMMYAEMAATAHGVVEQGAPGAPRTERRQGFMRYYGQGHEIAVDLPARDLGPADLPQLQAAFDEAYRRLYGREIPGVDIEVMGWTIEVASAAAASDAAPAAAPQPYEAKATGRRPVFDPAAGRLLEFALHRRADLRPGARIAGPAVIVEDETSTVVAAAFDAEIDRFGYILLTRREG